MFPLHHFTLVTAAVLVLLLAKWAMQFWLARLNSQSVRAHSKTVPAAFAATMDAATYEKSVAYTLAKNHLEKIELTWDALLLLVILFSGALPWFWDFFRAHWGISVWNQAAWLFSVGIVLTLPGLPLEWYAQFRLEERFGFNTTNLKTWLMDRVKGFLLALLIGFPSLAGLLKIVESSGARWWIYAWAALFAFQLVMLVLAPILIMPLFNKFTPLPPGDLRERLLALGRRTGFRAQSIQVMDGSKRSRHSNAFFTGFGSFRKIVLFDTLIQQLAEPELEAVLAHEVGHYKKGHVPKMLAWSAVSSLAGFYLISVLQHQPWFFTTFGFSAPGTAPALLLFALLAGVITFWFSPLAHRCSRKHEYEADAYAAQTMREIGSLLGALRKLNEKNLSNLTPHPLYSGFYYSHPTLLEREAALQNAL